MIDRSKKGGGGLLEELDLPDLPPMAGDDEDGVAILDLSFFVEDPGAPEHAGDDGPEISDGEIRQVSAGLIDVVDEGWLDDDEGAAAHVSEALEEEEDEERWSADQDEGDGNVGLEDGWFVDDDEAVWHDEDGGAEGPDRDAPEEIDSSAWEDAADWEETDEDLDGPGVGALVDELDLDGGAEGTWDRSVSLPREYLGPLDGEVAALAFTGGGVAAAGGGIFGMGADGMLHRRELIADLEANSIIVYEGVTFLGTRRHGAVAFMRDGGPVRALNGWNEMGSDDPGGLVSTELRIDAVRRGRIFRLLGWTGSGHLFCSDDYGTAWWGPVTEGRCLAMAVDRAQGAVVSLEERDGRMVLARSVDLASWTEVVLPADLAQAVRAGDARLAVAGGTVALAVRAPSVPLFVSIDFGETWRESEAVTGALALATDPGDPGTVFAATYDPDQGVGRVLVTDDGGVRWARIFETDRGSPLEEVAATGRGEISWIGVDGSEDRTLFVVSSEGVYAVRLGGRPTAH